MTRDRWLRIALIGIALLFACGGCITWPFASTIASEGRFVRVAMRGGEAPDAGDGRDRDRGFAAPVRDPFVPLPTNEARPVRTARPMTPAPSYAPIPGIPILPSNLGAGSPRNPAADRAGVATSDAPIVQAVAVGEHRFALVQSGSTIRMVAPGDRIGDATIVRVDALGVVLSTGVRLTFASANDARKESP